MGCLVAEEEHLPCALPLQPQALSFAYVSVYMYHVLALSPTI